MNRFAISVVTIVVGALFLGVALLGGGGQCVPYADVCSRTQAEGETCCGVCGEPAVATRRHEERSMALDGTLVVDDVELPYCEEHSGVDAQGMTPADVQRARALTFEECVDWGQVKADHDKACLASRAGDRPCCAICGRAGDHRRVLKTVTTRRLGARSEQQKDVDLCDDHRTADAFDVTYARDKRADPTTGGGWVRWLLLVLGALCVVGGVADGINRLRGPQDPT